MFASIFPFLVFVGALLHFSACYQHQHAWHDMKPLVETCSCANQCDLHKNMEKGPAFLAFEKHKLPLAVFIHCIDFGRQAFPEVVDLHGVARDHWVVPNPPKPLVLQRRTRWQGKIIIIISCFQTSRSLSTLNTKSSCRRMARVLKPPSQMLGLELGLEGLDPCGGRWGLAWRSCFRGSEGGWKRGGGTVGGGRVGCGALSGGPTKTQIIFTLTD